MSESAAQKDPGPRGAPCRREAVVALLVAVYLIVSVVAYTDYPRPDFSPPLTPLERRGLALWRSHNCQACHQIHGFGGFLGPDLTNRVGDDTPLDEIGSVLEFGNGRMPAFHFTVDEQESIVAYLRAVNRTGRSTPPAPPALRTPDRPDHFALLAGEWSASTGAPLPADAARGLEVWTRNQCGACHHVLAQGKNLAPDVSGRAVDRSQETLAALLDRGRGRMPSFPIGAPDRRDLAAFLDWTCNNRSELSRTNVRLLGREAFSWAGVPWFEYPR